MHFPHKTIVFTLLRLAAVALVSIAIPARADVKVPTIFGDHAVLQQDAPIPVWGTADPGEKVTVTVGTNTASAPTYPDGRWRVTLAPLPPTSKPLTMTIAGKNTLTFSDVLVGEVWFASGQSNMGFSLSGAANAATEIPQAADPQLRFFHFGTNPGLEPSHSFALGKWVLSAPETAPGFSAVAYFFAKELREKLHRPVAIIQSAWGGTSCEAWTPIDAIKKDPALANYARSYDKVQDASEQVAADLPAKMDAWKKDVDLWNKEVGTTYNPLLTAWTAEAAKAKAAGQTPPPRPIPSRPKPPTPSPPWGGAGTPSVLYNGEVAPVIPFAIRGVVWYQGESNVGAASEYHALLSALITGWRDHWAAGDFPFIIVQLPKFLGPPNWPLLREAQAKTLALPNTAMAITIDLGDPNNIHPVDKVDVGHRVALVARHLAYGEKDLVWTGPIYDSMKVEGNTIRLSFTQTGGGLAIGSSPWVPPHTQPIPTTSLLGFAIADDKHQWHPAAAKIDGNTVVVSNKDVPQPRRRPIRVAELPRLQPL